MHQLVNKYFDNIKMRGTNVKKKSEKNGGGARISTLPDDGVTVTLKHVGAVLM